MHIDVAQLALGVQQVRVLGSVAALQVGHGGAELGALLAQVGDGVGAEGRADVRTVAAPFQLLLGRAQARLGLGLV